MTDYTKTDFVLTAFASREAIENAAQALVSLDGKVSANIGRAAWGLAVLTAIEQPEMGTAAIVADVVLAMGLEAAKGQRHQPLSSRLRVALAYVRNDASPVKLPTQSGADDTATAIAKAERFIGRYNVTAMFAAGSKGRSDKAETRAKERAADAEKAEKATLHAAGVTAKMPFSLSAILESDDFVGVMAAAKAGDANGLKMAEHIVHTLQAAIVSGGIVISNKADKAKAKAKARAAKVTLKAVA